MKTKISQLMKNSNDRIIWITGIFIPSSLRTRTRFIWENLRRRSLVWSRRIYKEGIKMGASVDSGIHWFYINKVVVIKRKQWLRTNKRKQVSIMWWVKNMILSWYHSNYHKKWFILCQIRGRVVIFRNQIHRELGNQINLISLIKLC